MRLSDYLKQAKMKPSDFAKASEVALCIIWKHLNHDETSKNGNTKYSGRLSLETADKIIRASNGMVSLSDLLNGASNKPPVAESGNSTGPAGNSAGADR